VDTRDLDALDSIFTADASIDYTAMGGIKGGVPEVKAYLAEAMALFAKTQHMPGLPSVVVDGDRARATVPTHNPMKFEGNPTMLFCGLWYHHDLVRTGEGWRIASLREEKAYMKTLNPETGKGDS
jgi:hypothetical protein